MILKKWDDIPEKIRCSAVKQYYDILVKHKARLYQKRVFDIILSSILILLTSPIIFIAAIAIKMDSKGPVLFRQDRITRYGKSFSIFKLRTMVADAEQNGSLVTVKGDTRITRVGMVLRKIKADEFPQLLNVLIGDMSFVGTRPEVEKYVRMYTDEMKATLLLSAGITSKASIKFRDEEKILEESLDIDKDYVEKVLPGKMKYNLEYLQNAGLWYDFGLILKTGLLVMKRVFVKKDHIVNDDARNKVFGKTNI